MLEACEKARKILSGDTEAMIEVDCLYEDISLSS